MSVLRIKDRLTGRFVPIAAIKGDKGDNAGFGTVEASVDANYGTPSVEVTASGEDTAKNFSFAFHNLKQAPYNDSDLRTQIATERARIDSFTHLAEGSTTGDAELIDGRTGADGVTYTNIGTANRTQFSNLKSDINEVSEQTYNLVIGILSGLTVDGSGGMQNWGGTTDMVIAPVTTGKTYTVKTDDSTGFVGAFYNSIPTASTTASYNNSRVIQASKTFTAPISGYVAFRTSRDYAQAQIVEGSADRAYIKPKTAVDIIARESIDNLMTPVFEYTDIDDITITDKYFMNSSGGNAGPYDDWEYGKISVSEGETYKITTKTGSYALPWLLLNGSSVISYSSYPVGQPVAYVTEMITIPQNAQYLVVNNRKDGNITIQRLKQTGTGIDGRKVYLNDMPLSSLIKGEDVLSGKVLCCCGDSITYGADMDAAGITQESNITVFQSDNNGNFTETTSNFLKTWNWIIANRNNMTLYNAGVSGSTMQGLADKNGFSLANGRYTKLPDDIDYLLLWFGWNDTAYGTLGAITDTTNESYYGGYNVVLPYLINKYPYAKIALIVPFGTDAGHRDAIRQLGNKWGVAVWDNYQGGTPLYYGKEPSVGVEASVVTANQAKFQANGAHPNYRGHKQLADMIEEFIRGI